MAIVGEPRSVREAIESSNASKWELNMQEEYKSLIANGTWELTALPKGCKAVKCTWVFCTKKYVNGVVVCFKAKLVANGCSQMKGVDFGKTFVPMAKFNTIKVILAIRAAIGLEMHQMNVKTTFLNGELDVVIYMEQLKGFVQKGREHEEITLRIEATWTSMVRVHSHIFVNKSFTKSYTDYLMYVLQTCDYIIIVIIYVDDLIILASNVNMINELKSSLKREFDMSDLGELHFVLGVHFREG